MSFHLDCNFLKSRLTIFHDHVSAESSKSSFLASRRLTGHKEETSLRQIQTCKLALAMQEHPYINSRITIIATITTVNFLHPTQWKFHCPSESGLRPTHTTIQSENSMDLTFLASIHRSHSALDGTFGTHNPAHKREKHNSLQSFVHIVITC